MEFLCFGPVIVHAKKPTIKPSAHHASDAKTFILQPLLNSLVLHVMELRIHCSSAACLSPGIKPGDTIWLKELNFVTIVWVRNICCQIFPVTDPAIHRTDSSPTSSNSAGVRTGNEAQALSQGQTGQFTSWKL